MSNRHMSNHNPSRAAAIRRRPLAAALLVALALPGFAFAQTAKEVELEARVAELEKMVCAPASSTRRSPSSTSARN